MANKLKLSINEVSDVVNTGDGLQILKGMSVKVFGFTEHIYRT